jgi:sugar transferase EpsL
MRRKNKSQGRTYIKRSMDLILGIPLIILISPIILVLILILLFSIGFPVFFTQPRPGKNGILFKIIKFRTMRNAVAPDGTPLPDEQRLTPLGKFMRSASLDELPELINVLKGDMSLVGPRPLLVAYLDRYSPEQARRHDVRPGITGWAQVNGRNALTWEEKFALDVWYVDHWSFWLDVKILFMTVWKVFKRESINTPGSATSPEFLGSSTSTRDQN